MLWLALIVGFSAGLFLFNNQKVEAVGYGPGSILINEFTVGGTQWVELLNTTESDIDFDSGEWNFIVSAMGPGGSTTTLSGKIPQKGILTSAVSLPTTTAMLSVYCADSNTTTYTVSYGAGFNMGEPHIADVPEDGESAALQQDTSWSIDTTPSKGWFNNAIDYDCPATSSTTPPTLSSIASCLLFESSVDTNMDDLADPSSAGGLYFEKINKGKITFNSLLNLTDNSVVQALQSLGEKMELAAGSLKFDSTLAQDMSSATATLIMYGMGDYGYTSEPKLIIRDDSGLEISTSSPEYPALNNLTFNTSTGDFTFITNHFTQYDGSPVLLEVTPVPVTTTDQSPDYTFSSNVAGSVYFGGDCGSTPSTTMISGNNTITFATLATGAYSNCYLIGIDGAGNSSTLNISSFTIEEGAQPPPAPTINQINGLASTTQYSNNPDLEIYIGGYGTSTPNFIEVYGSSTLLLTYTPTTAPSVATTTLSSEGSWDIYAKSIKDGLTSTASNVYVYNYDITKPQVTNFTASPTVFSSNDSILTITVVFDEIMDTSDVNPVSVVITLPGEGLPRNVEMVSFTSNTWTGTTTLSEFSAEQTLAVTVGGGTDLAGNTMDDDTSWTVEINTIAPTISFIDNVSATAVTSDSIEVSIMGDVNTATLYYGFKADDSCDASVSYIYPYGNNIAFTITSSLNNGKYICAKAVDSYGNIRYQASNNPLNIVGYVGVNTLEATGLGYTGATLNGEITALGGMNATHRGFYYGTSNPYSNSAITSGSYGLGSFTHALSSLTDGTVYQFIAMASNTAGITTGTTKTFITYFEPSTSTPTSTIDSTYTSTTTIPVPSDVTNAVLDMTSLESSGSVTTPGPVVVNASTSIGLVKLEIPDNTTIFGTGWDGNLILPTIKENSSVNVTADSGKTASVNTVVEIGFGDTALTFDKAVRILIPGMGGKDAGYYRGTTFTKISNSCNSDSSSGMPSGAVDCRITVGSDLVIWTKHFTKFIAYTQTSTGGGGGGTPISRPILGNIPVTVAGGNIVTSRNISLSFDVTGVSMMAISENSNYAGASWEMYVSPKTFTISEGYGSKTLYIKFRSGSGGETTTSIVINYVAPTTEVTTVTTEIPTTQTTVADTAGFTFTFRAGLTEKQKQSIMNLVNSGRLFSQADARNYAWAVGISDWQQFVGKNPKTIVVAGEVSSHYVFTKYLGVGSVGNDVKALQQILKELGYFTYPYVTSYYGSMTKEAVIKYQKAKGLSPYPGHVGPATRAALNAE